METMTILLVEDQADIRELYTLVLELAGYCVIAVADAPAALDILGTRPVDVLVTDYQMPEISGAKLIDAVRRHHPALRTILTSGQPEVAALATSCAAHAWYRKGTPLDELVATVAATLNVQVPSREDAVCCV